LTCSTCTAPGFQGGGCLAELIPTKAFRLRTITRKAKAPVSSNSSIYQAIVATTCLYYCYCCCCCCCCCVKLRKLLLFHHFLSLRPSVHSSINQSINKYPGSHRSCNHHPRDQSHPKIKSYQSFVCCPMGNTGCSSSRKTRCGSF